MLEAYEELSKDKFAEYFSILSASYDSDDALFEYLKNRTLENAKIVEVDFAELITADDIADAISSVLEDSANGSHLSLIVEEYLGNVINDSEEFDELLYDVVSEFKVDNDLSVIIDDAFANGNYVDKALFEVFGIGTSEADSVEALDNRIGELIDKLLPKYKETLDSLKEIEGEVGIKELLDTLVTFKINGLEILDGELNVNKDNLISLVKEIPTPADVSVMAKEDMYLSYDFFIGTTFCDVEFNLTLAIADDCDESIYESIRDKFGVLDGHYKFDYSENGVSAFLEVPELLTDAVKKLLRPCDVILLKASHSIRLGRVADALIHENN
jgi:hypothetical protein